MKRQVIIIISIVTVSFLIGTMFNDMAKEGQNPFVRIWEAINGLESRGKTGDIPIEWFEKLGENQGR